MSDHSTGTCSGKQQPCSAWGPPTDVLIALCGLSPAVLTETVWALAHEAPPTIPDRVFVLTTTAGRTAIERDLIDSGAWERLREALGVSAGSLVFGSVRDDIRVFPAGSRAAELDDIAYLADSVAAADFTLETLRQFSEAPETRIVFSIAGGRKTMTALAALCMTLLGREQDRLCHVLVQPPFDSPMLEPRFYFPDDAPRKYRSRDGTVHSAGSARINLCDIPFVRVRYLLDDEQHRQPKAFMRTVEYANSRIAAQTQPPTLHLCPPTMECRIDDIPIRLSAAEFAMYWMMAEHKRKEHPPYTSPRALHAAFDCFANEITTEQMPEAMNNKRFRPWRTDERETYRLASKLKASIQAAVGQSPRYAACIPNPARARYGFSSLGELGIDIRCQ